MTAIAIDLSQIIPAEAKTARALIAARARIRERRDQAIRAGTALMGHAISTDDLSQSRIVGVALSAMLDPTYTVQWKTATGFILLDAAGVLEVATAIRAHVQTCFDREAELLAALDTEMAMDVETGWP